MLSLFLFVYGINIVTQKDDKYLITNENHCLVIGNYGLKKMVNKQDSRLPKLLFLLALFNPREIIPIIQVYTVWC